MKKMLFLTKAYDFAAQKHTKQRRKGVNDVPYINHPIEVANLLCYCCDNEDADLLIAAVLHDTIEDTDATEQEVCDLFGAEIGSLVMEVTDDMRLSKKVRRRLQIEKAHNLSDRAKQIKVADKTCNIIDMLTTRLEWTKRRKKEYISWAAEVVGHCRGVNLKLDKEFDKAYKLAENTLGPIS